MSKKTEPTAALIRRSKLPTLQKPDINTNLSAAGKPSQLFSEATEEPRRGGFMRSILRELSAGREYRDDESFKDFTHLTRSLEKYFSTAETVDRQTGKKELRQGGLRRVAAELRKRFKRLGMPVQRAKHFSQAMTEAMGRKGVEQINFSLNSSDPHLNTQQTTNSFQLSATRVRSHDLSLNLRSGGCSLQRTQFETLSGQRQPATVLTGFAAASEPQSTGVNQAATNSGNSLHEIKRALQQSAIMQRPPPANSIETEEAMEALFEQGLDSLQQLFAGLKGLTEQSSSVFELRVQIRNLRVERDAGDNHLRFSVAALAPIGLSVIDESGQAATLYPRPGGRFGTFIADDSKETV